MNKYRVHYKHNGFYIGCDVVSANTTADAILMTRYSLIEKRDVEITGVDFVGAG